MIIEIAEELFEQLGYKLLIAKIGKEAIETYEKNKELIDIVLLDNDHAGHKWQRYLRQNERDRS